MTDPIRTFEPEERLSPLFRQSLRSAVRRTRAGAPGTSRPRRRALSRTAHRTPAALRSAAATTSGRRRHRSDRACSWLDRSRSPISRAVAEAGLFRPRGGAPLELYAHQVEMLRFEHPARRRRRHSDRHRLGQNGSHLSSRTCGTRAGSPQRGRTWPLPPRNDWWAMDPPPGSRNRVNHPRISQRPTSRRPASRHPGAGAVSAQRACGRPDCPSPARSRWRSMRGWLAANRPGNRFWFGRYTGWTPISGRPQRDGAEAELRKELRRLSDMAARVPGRDAERFFPRFDGGEMWSRWDMQEAPPDILITNYSMLNIMLMRDVEAAIFDADARVAAAGSRRTSSIWSSTSFIPIAAHPAPRSATFCASSTIGWAGIRIIRSCGSSRPAHRLARRSGARAGLPAAVLWTLAAIYAYSRRRERLPGRSPAARAAALAAACALG